MIIREILDEPSREFDYFNDFSDTMAFLEKSDQDDIRVMRAIDVLTVGYNAQSMAVTTPDKDNPEKTVRAEATEVTRENTKYHIGDGVYASCDGYHIWVETPRIEGTHEIALEPAVFDMLVEYRDRIIAAN